MPQDYVHDIFISYRHAGPAFTWVTEYFYPLLRKWLPEFMPVDHIISDESIFVDSQIETGTSWPIRLREALRNSRCLISVWSPQYFQSNWCLAELHSMLQREQILGLRNGQNWSGLIYPVVFKSAQLLPTEYHYIQYKDLSRWGIDEPSFRDSPEFLNLVIKIQDICEELSPIIQRAPAWQEDWPVVLPEPYPRVSAALPRFQ